MEAIGTVIVISDGAEQTTLRGGVVMVLVI